MKDQVSIQQFHDAEGLADWRVLGEGASVHYRTASFAESAALVRAIAEIADVDAHPPAVDVRAGGVTVRLVTSAADYFGMTERDVRVAQKVSAVARELGLSADVT